TACAPLPCARFSARALQAPWVPRRSSASTLLPLLVALSVAAPESRSPWRSPRWTLIPTAARCGSRARTSRKTSTSRSAAAAVATAPLLMLAQLGAFHTLELELNKQFTLSKSLWDTVALGAPHTALPSRLTHCASQSECASPRTP